MFGLGRCVSFSVSSFVSSFAASATRFGTGLLHNPFDDFAAVVALLCSPPKRLLVEVDADPSESEPKPSSMALEMGTGVVENPERSYL
jgi:hypothetical protein